MNHEDYIKRRAVRILWDNNFSIGTIMHLFGLTRKQAWDYTGL